MRYRDTGVDIDRGNEAVRRIRHLLEQFQPAFRENIGRFGGLLPLAVQGMAAPHLVASIDGVGTKTRVAALVDRWEVCGRDVIAHGINDVLVQGAFPLAALDYLGMGRIVPERVEAIVRGMLEECTRYGVVLIGGETAELPDVYAHDDVDVVAVVIGLVDGDRVLDGQTVQPGDRLLGLPSTGLHTNGYTLARKLFFERLGWAPDRWLDECQMTLADALLQPHRCYLPYVKPLLERGLVRGLAHITGGGLTENVPRSLPKGTTARIRLGTWPVPPIFELIQRLGDVPPDEMFRTFNMGIGMVVIVRPYDEPEVRQAVEALGLPVYPIGEVEAGSGGVVYG
jgi:phosphoribosylformylglycinamidine cyclo-ligase